MTQDRGVIYATDVIINEKREPIRSVYDTARKETQRRNMKRSGQLTQTMRNEAMAKEEVRQVRRGWQQPG